MKKKIAICFSGLPSYIDQNKGYWLDVIEKYDADVYASLWGDEENVYPVSYTHLTLPTTERV